MAILQGNCRPRGIDRLWHLWHFAEPLSPVLRDCHALPGPGRPAHQPKTTRKCRDARSPTASAGVAAVFLEPHSVRRVGSCAISLVLATAVAFGSLVRGAPLS